MPYFQRRVGGIDTFLAGRSLARTLAQLDTVASDLRVSPLSSFGFNDDLRNEPLRWHPPQEGLGTVTTLLHHLTEHPAAAAEPIVEDLRKWQSALEKAVAADIPFCVLLLHGNTTSGHEWDVRKGSAF